jgi:hypothetical protein
LITATQKGSSGDIDTADLAVYSKSALRGFQAYFRLIAKEDVAAAQAAVQEQHAARTGSFDSRSNTVNQQGKQQQL